MRKRRILIVEDEPIIAMDEKAILEELGYEVVGIVCSGEEAIRFAANQRPNVVLMDIGLAGKMDGIEASRKLRDLYHIPALFVTSYGDKQQSAQIRDPAVEKFAYIIKPYTKIELTKALDDVIRQPYWDINAKNINS